MAQKPAELEVSSVASLKTNAVNAVAAGIKVEAGPKGVVGNALKARIEDLSEAEIVKGGRVVAEWALNKLSILNDDTIQERWTIDTHVKVYLALKTVNVTEKDLPIIDKAVLEVGNALNARINSLSEGAIEKGGPHVAKWALDMVSILSNDKMQEWWTIETLSKVTLALKMGVFTEKDLPTIDKTVLKDAIAAFEKFINFIPALYLTNPGKFETRLCEIFSKALQSVSDAQLTYVEVLLKAVDYRLLEHLHGKFVDRHMVELKQQSPFRKEILAWAKESKHKVDYKTPLFPITEACEARTIEIDKVYGIAGLSGPFYPDDDLVRVVNEVCSTSKSYAYRILGIPINSSGAFDDVREQLIEINERRKAGKLRALTDTFLSSKRDLEQCVRILTVAYDKLYTQMESSAVNLNTANTGALIEEMKKNKRFQKVLSETKKKLDLALAELAKLSPYKVEVVRLKSELLQKEMNLRQLTTQLNAEMEARVRAERKLAEVQQQHKVEMAERERAAIELEKMVRSLQADLKKERGLTAELYTQNDLLKLALANQQKERIDAQTESLSATATAAFNSPEKSLPVKPQKLSSAHRALSFHQSSTTKERQNPEQPELLTPIKERDVEGPSAFSKTFTPGGVTSPN